MDPRVAESHEPDQRITFQRAPDLTNPENVFMEKDAVLVGRMQPRQPGQALIESCPVNEGSMIHIVQAKTFEPEATSH